MHSLHSRKASQCSVKWLQFSYEFKILKGRSKATSREICLNKCYQSSHISYKQCLGTTSWYIFMWLIFDSESTILYSCQQCQIRNFIAEKRMIKKAYFLCLCISPQKLRRFEMDIQWEKTSSRKITTEMCSYFWEDSHR